MIRATAPGAAAFLLVLCTAVVTGVAAAALQPRPLTGSKSYLEYGLARNELNRLKYRNTVVPAQ